MKDVNLIQGAYMRFNGNLGFLLLAIYLILVGLALLIPAFAIPAVVLGILALASGIPNLDRSLGPISGGSSSPS